MADILSPKERSERMSRVRGSDTKPEIIFRKALWREGLRYRLRYKLFGRPDIVFPGPKVAVFIDGCFWHGCPEHYRPPKTRTEWWDNKIAGNKKRDLAREVPSDLPLPNGFKKPTVALPGILVLEAPRYTDATTASEHLAQLCATLESETTQATSKALAGFPLLLLVDDSVFASRTLNNLLWTTFTRSNPSHDIHGLHSFTEHKHWGCRGSLIIDARLKPHHAPPLLEDPTVTAQVDQLGAPGGPLNGVI